MAAECFERVRRLFIARAILVEFGRARCACRGRWQGVKRRMCIFAIALNAANFLVELQIV